MLINNYQILKEANLSNHSLERVIERVISIKGIILPEGFNEFKNREDEITTFFKKEIGKRIGVLKKDNRGVGNHLYSYVLARCYIQKDVIKKPITLLIDGDEGSIYYGSIVNNLLTTIILSKNISDDAIKITSIRNNPNIQFKEVLHFEPNVDLIFDLTEKKNINTPIEISQLSEKGKILFNLLKDIKVKEIVNLANIDNYINLANQFVTLNKTANESERNQVALILDKLNIKKQELNGKVDNKNQYSDKYIDLVNQHKKLFLNPKKVESKQKKAMEFYESIKDFSNNFSDILPNGIKKKVSDMEIDVTNFLKTRKLMEELGIDVSDF